MASSSSSTFRKTSKRQQQHSLLLFDVWAQYRRAEREGTPLDGDLARAHAALCALDLTPITDANTLARHVRAEPWQCVRTLLTRTLAPSLDHLLTTLHYTHKIKCLRLDDNDAASPPKTLFVSDALPAHTLDSLVASWRFVARFDTMHTRQNYCLCMRFALDIRWSVWISVAPLLHRVDTWSVSLAFEDAHKSIELNENVLTDWLSVLCAHMRQPHFFLLCDHNASLVAANNIQLPTCNFQHYCMCIEQTRLTSAPTQFFANEWLPRLGAAWLRENKLAAARVALLSTLSNEFVNAQMHAYAAFVGQLAAHNGVASLASLFPT